MTIYVYKGAYRLLRKSGVGKAIEHQQQLLSEYGKNMLTNRFIYADIIHINSVFPDSIMIALLSKLLGKKVICFAHSTMEDFKNSFKGSDCIAPIFKKWITFCYNRGDMIITPTMYSKSLLMNYDIEPPIVAISNGIDNGYWNKAFVTGKEGRRLFTKKYGLPYDKKIIISVGHYIERKGIIDFINLAKMMPDASFVWFGYTNLNCVPNKIKVAIHNKPNNLYMPGFVESNELRQAYHSADAFCFMSREETEGIVVLEALSSGIPTLVRNIEVYDDWLIDGESVIKCCTLDEYKYNLYRIFGNDKKKLVQNGLRVAAKKDYYAIYNKYTELYELLLGEKNE